MKTAIREVVASAKLWRIWVIIGSRDVKLSCRRSKIGVSWVYLN